MKKMLITLIIEGGEEDLMAVRGDVLRTASCNIVSANSSFIEEGKKEIEAPAFMYENLGGH